MCWLSSVSQSFHAGQKISTSARPLSQRDHGQSPVLALFTGVGCGSTGVGSFSEGGCLMGTGFCAGVEAGVTGGLAFVSAGFDSPSPKRDIGAGVELGSND